MKRTVAFLLPRVRRFFVLGFLTFSLGLSLSCAARQASIPESDNGPRAVFEVKTINLGVVGNMEEILADFKVKNTGNEPLIFKKATKSCGCTDVFYPEQIAPGKTGKVTLLIDARKKTGTLKVDATVFTNEGKGYRHKLQVSAKLLGDVIFKPSNSIEIRGGQLPAYREIMFTNTGYRPILLKELFFYNKEYKKFLRTEIQPINTGFEYKLLFEFDDTVPRGKRLSTKLDLVAEVGGTTTTYPIAVMIYIPE